MLGGLKDKAMGKALALFEEKMDEKVRENVTLFTELKPADVQDDEKYTKLIVDPLWLVVEAQTGGTLSSLQKFIDVKSKFKEGLFQVREELITVEGDEVKLNPDFTAKIGPTINKALKQ